MWFNDENYENEGHITPITQWQINKFTRESKMKIVSLTTFGDPYEETKRSWKKLYVFARLLEKLYSKSSSLKGSILVAVFALSDVV
jgi:hypothetical protein